VEIETIRRLYVPELVFRLHQALYETREFSQRYDCPSFFAAVEQNGLSTFFLCASNLQKSINLADTVADERYMLWHQFVGPKTNRLGDFLARVRSSSLTILESSNDPLVLESK
jgi:nuclear pore complex protein Nup107